MRRFSARETARLSGCLERLAPHLRLNSIAITGGVGIELGMAVLGQPGTRDSVADLDLVATSIDALDQGAVGHFLVSHYHVEGPGVPKFMAQLVDPVSRIRIDIFPDLVGSIGDAWTARVGTHSIPVLPLERIFDHKLQTLSRASPAAPIDPKHVHDAHVLGAVLHKPVPPVPDAALAPDVYGSDDWNCRRCQLSQNANWPLAPKDRICDLLGWTRQPERIVDSRTVARPAC